jgi:hypothetical protein
MDLSLLFDTRHKIIRSPPPGRLLIDSFFNTLQQRGNDAKTRCTGCDCRHRHRSGPNDVQKEEVGHYEEYAVGNWYAPSLSF